MRTLRRDGGFTSNNGAEPLENRTFSIFEEEPLAISVQCFEAEGLGLRYICEYALVGCPVKKSSLVTTLLSVVSPWKCFFFAGKYPFSVVL